jgi:hypothetical protein
MAVRTVLKYRGRQRQLLKDAIKICVRLQADNVKHAATPVANNTMLTSYVNHLLDSLVVENTETVPA